MRAPIQIRTNDCFVRRIVGFVIAGLLLNTFFAWMRDLKPVTNLAAALKPGHTAVSSELALGRQAETTHQACEVALANLLCAQGLQGAEDLKLDACLATLDQWARRVRSETERHLYRFRASPEEFENSEGYFRMLMMTVVLSEDFRVHYNPERIAGTLQSIGRDGFFADSRDVLLHGLLGSRRAGTCSSMPVLLVALGRRLGYPLKLVTTKGNLFARWERDSERFNIEAAGKG